MVVVWRDSRIEKFPSSTKTTRWYEGYLVAQQHDSALWIAHFGDNQYEIMKRKEIFDAQYYIIQ